MTPQDSLSVPRDLIWGASNIVNIVGETDVNSMFEFKARGVEHGGDGCGGGGGAAGGPRGGGWNGGFGGGGCLVGGGGDGGGGL